jgi:hypothetical protein
MVPAGKLVVRKKDDVGYQNRLPEDWSANAQYAFGECMVSPVMNFVTWDPRRLYVGQHEELQHSSDPKTHKRLA